MFWILLLANAGFLAGALNAVAGGGTFLTLPALVFLGVPPITANATSTVAVLPGYISAVAFRNHINPAAGVGLLSLIVTALLGGIAGACLLLVTLSDVFRRSCLGSCSSAPCCLQRGPDCSPGYAPAAPGMQSVLPLSS